MKPTFSTTRFLAILAAGAVLGFGSFLIDAPSAPAATATSEVQLTSQLVDESGVLSEPVSYTHLTLPTILRV